MANRLNSEMLVGSWEGTNRLWLDPRGAGETTAATARVALVAGVGFLSVTYTWSFESKPQDGLLLLRRAEQPGPLDAVWVDSFHTGGAFMVLQGEEDRAGRRSLYGTYAAQEGPEWGWRIALDGEDDVDGFRMAMWNVPPGGVDEHAVEARFWRTGGG